MGLERKMMKVKDLIKTIEKLKQEIPDIMEYDVYTEQLSEGDKEYKRKPVQSNVPWHHKDNGQGWDFVSDCEKWEYFKCEGFNTIMKDKKIFTINVNF